MSAERGNGRGGGLRLRMLGEARLRTVGEVDMRVDSVACDMVVGNVIDEDRGIIQIGDVRTA